MTKDSMERNFNIKLDSLKWEQVLGADVYFAEVGPYTVWQEGGNYTISRNNSVLRWRVDLSQYVERREA